MWCEEFFDKAVKHPNGKLRAKCKYCKKDLVGDGSLSGTSTLISHMTICEKNPHSIAKSNVRKLVLDHIGKLRSKIIDQEVLDEKIFMIIIKHDLAYFLLNIKGLGS